MSSDSIEEMLRQSSTTVASQIARKTKEKAELQKQLNDYENSITKLEAEIEIHQERKEELHRKLSEKKDHKRELYAKRDKLIEEKRSLQDQAYKTNAGDDEPIQQKISEKSDEIGKVIETSKELVDEMNEIYEQAQEENKLVSETRDKFHQLKYESKNQILSYKQKISKIDNELKKLRKKMGTIRDKLDNLPEV